MLRYSEASGLNRRNVGFADIAGWECNALFTFTSSPILRGHSTISVTNDLERRITEHKQKLVHDFTAKYSISQLVHHEEFGDVVEAIAREKQIKGRTRAKKIALIESDNQRWDDLSVGW